MIIGLHLKPRGTGKVPKIKLSGDVFVCKRIGFAPFYDLIFDSDRVVFFVCHFIR